MNTTLYNFFNKLGTDDEFINDIAIDDETSVTNVTSETSSVSVLEKFKAATIAMMTEKQITISSIPESSSLKPHVIENIDDFKRVIKMIMDVEYFVDMYEKDLSYKDKKSLVCEYGMGDAYNLAYEFYTISRKYTREQFWKMHDDLDSDDLPNMMIKLVIFKAVGFNDKQISMLMTGRHEC